jgi:hypothetical protein
MTGTIRLELFNRVAEIETLSNALADFSKSHGLHPRTLYAANLASEELAINLMAYAWDDGLDHRFAVEFRLRKDEANRELNLVLADDGLTYNPFDMAAIPNLTPNRYLAAPGLCAAPVAGRSPLC